MRNYIPRNKYIYFLPIMTNYRDVRVFNRCQDFCMGGVAMESESRGVWHSRRAGCEVRGVPRSVGSMGRARAVVRDSGPPVDVWQACVRVAGPDWTRDCR